MKTESNYVEAQIATVFTVKLVQNGTFLAALFIILGSQVLLSIRDARRKTGQEIVTILAWIIKPQLSPRALQSGVFYSAPCEGHLALGEVISISMKPSVVGQSHEEVSADVENPEVSATSCRPWRWFFSMSICAVVLASQIATFLASAEICNHFHDMARLQRWLWLSPLYVLGPYSAVALVMIFIHDTEGRFSKKSRLHRLTLSFAISNLFASLFLPMPEMFRDCGGYSPTRETLGYLGEALWVIFYAISEIILLILVYHKVRLLTKGGKLQRQSVWLGRSLSLMLLMFALMFLPLFVWHDFANSVWRLFFASGFTLAFITSTAIATRTMLFAADAAERVLVSGKSPQETRDASNMFLATYWTRWNAYATLASMASSIGLQIALFIWMYEGYQAGSVRLLADWLGALDFVLNAACAASLSGMIGEQTNIILAEGALEQVGWALIQQQEVANRVESST